MFMTLQPSLYELYLIWCVWLFIIWPWLAFDRGNNLYTFPCIKFYPDTLLPLIYSLQKHDYVLACTFCCGFKIELPLEGAKGKLRTLTGGRWGSFPWETSFRSPLCRGYSFNFSRLRSGFRNLLYAISYQTAWRKYSKLYYIKTNHGGWCCVFWERQSEFLFLEFSFIHFTFCCYIHTATTWHYLPTA